MNEIKDIFKSRIYIIIVGLLFAWAMVATILWSLCYRDYARLQSAIDSANAKELQQRYDAAIAELGRVTAALDRSEQSVAGLEDVDRRRDEGLRRISGIVTDTGKSISGVTSGNERTRIALEAIERIADELEKQSGGSAE